MLCIIWIGGNAKPKRSEHFVIYSQWTPHHRLSAELLLKEKPVVNDYLSEYFCATGLYSSMESSFS